ncbi:hypothetical protein [Micromonospora sp. NPDC005806]|uniref:hypothetical protein n=1 Tax=Micromonospora sp. NPDC005806 TaxID=3364234 RepID=UPI003688F8CE
MAQIGGEVDPGWALPVAAFGRMDEAGPSASYLLHDDGERLRVVLYLNHQGLPGA